MPAKKGIDHGPGGKMVKQCLLPNGLFPPRPPMVELDYSSDSEDSIHLYLFLLFLSQNVIQQIKKTK